MTNPDHQLSAASLLSDRDLLRRFVQDADERAFAEIVCRYQGLVMSVCRRVIGNETDVEDAFQATFIALARRPRQIKNVDSLSTWLYSVAWRTSVRLVRQRRKHPVEPLSENSANTDSDTLDRIASAQDCMVLDEELQTMPAKYREVLVMTYFAGQSSQEIADQLSVSKGTIDGRIREARNVLRVRLARRGVAIGVLAVAAGLSRGTAAAASPELLSSTIQLGAQSLSGSLPGTTDLSHLEPLIQVESTMIISKFVIASLLGASAVVGLMGMNGTPQDGGGGASGQPAALDTAVSDEPKGNAEESVPSEVDGPSIVAAEVQATPASAENSLTVYHLNSVAADSIADIIRSLVPDAQVQSDPRTNSLIVGATIEQQKAITSLLNQLDSVPISGSSELASVATGDRAKSDSGPRFKLYPLDAKPREKWMYELLEMPVPTMDFPGEIPLSEVIERIVDHYNGPDSPESAKRFKLTVVIDKVELSVEGVESLEDVTVSDLNFEGIELQNALKLIFDQTTEPELTYEIKDEVLLITTKTKAESDESLVTRVYDIGELADLDFGASGIGNYGYGGGGGQFSLQMGGGGMGGGGMGGGGMGMGGMDPAPVPEPPSLCSVVKEMTSPPCKWFEFDGEGGAIRLVSRSLVVRQTSAGHREVVRLLNLLTESVAASAGN